MIPSDLETARDIYNTRLLIIFLLQRHLSTLLEKHKIS